MYSCSSVLSCLWGSQCVRAGVAKWSQAREVPKGLVEAQRPFTTNFSGNFYSLEIVWILGDCGFDQLQGLLVLLLRGQQERQQVQRVDVVTSDVQGLPCVLQRLRYLQTTIFFMKHSHHEC